MVAPPSLGALPVVPQTGGALNPSTPLGAGPSTSLGVADPFDEVFLLSVLREELGAVVVDLPLTPIANAIPEEELVSGDPAGQVPLFRVDCFPGLIFDGAAGLPAGREDRQEESAVVVVAPPAPVPAPIDPPLVKIATGECYAPDTPIDERPAQEPPIASAPGDQPKAAAKDEPTVEADGNETTFAGGEGVRLRAKTNADAGADPAAWTAPPVVRLDVPATTWRADALKSREARELMNSKLAEGGAHVVITHAGAVAPSEPSVTAVAPIPATAFHTAASATATTVRTEPESKVPGENADRIVQSIRLQWARGGGEARITLEPSHLGELTVSLKVEQGVVSVRLQAEAPLVREWLQTHQQTLRQGLSEHQLTLDRLEIAAPAHSDHSRDRDDRQPRDTRDFREKRDRRSGRPHATFDLEA